MDISINSAVGLDHYDRPIPEKRAPLLFVLRAPQVLKPALLSCIASKGKGPIAVRTIEKEFSVTIEQIIILW